MKPDDFELELKKRNFRKLPSEWREQILDAAEESRRQTTVSAPARSSREGFIPNWQQWWRELLCPMPKTWAALAAAWLLIFILNYESSEQTPPIAQAEQTRLSRETLIALQQQRQLRAELYESVSRVSEPDTPAPRPRTARESKLVQV